MAVSFFEVEQLLFGYVIFVFGWIVLAFCLEGEVSLSLPIITVVDLEDFPSALLTVEGIERQSLEEVCKMIWFVEGVIGHSEAHEVNDVLESADEGTDLPQLADDIFDAPDDSTHFTHHQDPVIILLLQLYLYVDPFDSLENSPAPLRFIEDGSVSLL
jgi:hypothetical protein